jgi:putative iron-only hydrogenase system regulator
LPVPTLDAVETINAVLHEYGEYIIGRMGIPYRARQVNLICVAMDAPGDVINALTGSLGRIRGVTAKAAYGPVQPARGGPASADHPDK